MGLRSTSSPERRSAAMRLVAIERHHPDRDTTELRRQLAELQIADAIKAVVDKAPPLRPEQRERLANLLRGSRDEVA